MANNIEMKHYYNKTIQPVKGKISDLSVDIVISCIDMFDKIIEDSSISLLEEYNGFLSKYDVNLAADEIEDIIKNTHLNMIKVVSKTIDSLHNKELNYDELFTSLLKEFKRGDIITCGMPTNKYKLTWELYKQHIISSMQKQLSLLLSDDFNKLYDTFMDYTNDILSYATDYSKSKEVTFSDDFLDVIKIINKDSPLLNTILAEEDTEEIEDNSCKLPNIENYRDLNRLAESNGYEQIRQQGDHGIFVNKENDLLIIPQGRKVGKGLSKKICKQILNSNGNGGKNAKYNTRKLKGL